MAAILDFKMADMSSLVVKLKSELVGSYSFFQ